MFLSSFLLPLDQGACLRTGDSSLCAGGGGLFSLFKLLLVSSKCIVVRTLAFSDAQDNEEGSCVNNMSRNRSSKLQCCVW